MDPFKNISMLAPSRTSAPRILALIALSLWFTIVVRAQDTVAYYTFTGDLEGWTSTDLSFESSEDVWTWTQTGPSGTFPIGPLESTTAAGGYLLFDSDQQCSGSQNARIQSPVLNLSQESTVELRWQQRYRRFESAIYVEVSKDGGQTFAPFELSPALMNDEFSGIQGENPDYVTLDISPVAAGETAVVIAFRFYSEEMIFGEGAGCGYAWMVDDVAITNAILPAPQNDLAIISGSHAGASNSVIPTSQREALNLGARVTNNGIDASEGMLYVRIFDDSGTAPVQVYIDSVAVPTLAQGEESDFLLMPGSYTPPSDQVAYIGRYELVTTGATDEVAANNMARFDFSISESAFAKTTGPSIYARPQASESWGFGNIFAFQGVEDELSRVLFWLRPVGDFSTATTDSVFVEVYSIVGDTNGDGDYDDATEATLLNRQGYSLEGLNEPTRFFVTPLPDTGLTISPFTPQIAVFIRYEDALRGDGRWLEIGGGRDDLNTNYDAEQTAAALNGINRSFAIRSIGDGPLLSSLSAGLIPDVRAYVNENQLVGTSTTLSLSNALELWPNPSTTSVNWSLNSTVRNEDAVSIEIFDGLGKLVKETKEDTSVGISSIDVTELPSGLYHLIVKMESGKKAVEKFVKR